VAKKGRRSNRNEIQTVNNLDLLRQFEDFQANVLPGVRKDVLSGMDAETLYKKYAHLAAARAITIAASEMDSGKALAAAKDILDRSTGKATEKREVTHKYGNLTDEELRSLVATQLSEADDDDESEEDRDAE